MKAKIQDFTAHSPQAKLHVTGHSLATMISAQSIAKLYQDDPKAFDKIGEVQLFDGPDVVKSLKKMGLSDQDIQKIGEKVTYYVNPFDIVSMLNRTGPLDKQFGKVNIIVPLHFTTTLDDPISSHDFGEFQMNAAGQIRVASATYHPEFITAGKKLAHLVDEKVAQLKVLGLSDTVIMNLLRGDYVERGTMGYAIYRDFQQQYRQIIADAKKEALAWNKTAIPDYQQRIRAASGDQKISLRMELLDTVAQDFGLRAEELTVATKTAIETTKANILKGLGDSRLAMCQVVQYLDSWELSRFLLTLELSDFWDEGIEEAD
ncbi:hypothetical protein [Streptococcus cuniculi]|uniref:hypothetical protein n=1 Tax=Streptococcus cuniculi TaxID=1432788 RepID=UPI0018837EEC|nr:hypothetical protein [Streptococcus cuniculi]MBF0777448.1 hypothetical protein [Streptococcus cuniculi]